MEPAITHFAISCVRDSKNDDVILKLVNASTNAVTAQVELAGVGKISPEATRIVLQGAPGGNNSFERPYDIAPKTNAITTGESFNLEVEPNSFSLIRMKTKS